MLGHIIVGVRYDDSGYGLDKTKDGAEDQCVQRACLRIGPSIMALRRSFVESGHQPLHIAGHSITEISGLHVLYAFSTMYSPSTN